MDDKTKAYELRLVDKYLESINHYWSALLTINGLLLTFFSIDALSSDIGKSLLLNYTLICCCTLSLWLLLWNFRTIKKNYFDIGTLEVGDMPHVPEEVRQTASSQEYLRRLIDEYSTDWRKRNLEAAATRQRNMMHRESVIEALLVLETLLVLLILLGNKVFTNG